MPVKQSDEIENPVAYTAVDLVLPHFAIRTGLQNETATDVCMVALLADDHLILLGGELLRGKDLRVGLHGQTMHGTGPEDL